MRSWGVREFTLAFLLCFAVTNAHAADFQLVNPDTTGKLQTCGIRMTGQIIPGDLERLQAAAAPLPEGAEENTFTLCLFSPGGDYQEGLRIAAYLMERSVTTSLEPNAQCYSACALIFMAGGYTFEGNFISYRSMHKSALLGFHAPYLKGGTSQEVDTAAVYASAIRGIRDLANLGKKHHAQDDVMPNSLLAELLSKGPDEVFLIDTVYKAVNAKIRVIGISPPRVNVGMIGNACVNKFEETGTPDLDDPPQGWTGSDVRQRGAHYWFGGFGGEGVFFCVAKFPLERMMADFGFYVALHDTLVANQNRAIDEDSFYGVGSWYLYPPATALRNIP
jgi:ATP-dependent protease ClpP protease subunit